jgi:hypothetical protein
MKKWHVSLEETVFYDVLIEADSHVEAEQKASQIPTGELKPDRYGDTKMTVTPLQDFTEPEKGETKQICFAQCADWYHLEKFPYFELDSPEKEYFKTCNKELYQCFQPEIWDDKEFNLLIILDGRPVRVRSCHFDFYDKEVKIVDNT